MPEYIREVQNPVNRQEGNNLSVKALEFLADGTFPSGSAAYEKRGIAINVPEWDVTKCIQCNQCAFVCPHAAIRPVLTTDAEKDAAPAEFTSKPAIGAKGLNFTIAISAMDCSGCGNCVNACPAKEKALVLKPFATQEKNQSVFDYAVNPKKVAPKANPVKKETVKGSQFEQPLLEFSGACAGCGETPYAKLLTQLFGDRMMIANATGCSSIWGASAPAMPYTKNAQGHGPAWANSLFEDNAEFGLGMFLGSKAVRETLAADVAKAIEESHGSAALQEAMTEWLDNMNTGDGSRQRADALADLLENEKNGDELLNKIYENRDFLVKRSQWIFGGDGWAYDIGYGGVDHVLASGEDVNVFVFDTEVYSNTGGQASKATPTAAIAQFAATGKKTKKKDLGMLMMTYDNVYVAQCSMGANPNQLIKAIKEAEAHKGPSIVICYAPCINHGIKKGMNNVQQEMKDAVNSGYWNLYRYSPETKTFTLDSKEPTMPLYDFMKGEVRYASLELSFPENAKVLFAEAEEAAKEKYDSYKRRAEK